MAPPLDEFFKFMQITGPAQKDHPYVKAMPPMAREVILRVKLSEVLVLSDNRV